MTDNPFNRRDPKPGCWMVVCWSERPTDRVGKYELASSSAFETRKDAVRFARSIATNRHPLICRLESVNQ